MASATAEVSEILLATDEEFRRLKEEHHRFDDRIHELANKSWLNTDEELEEKKLKKQKLLLKDQMEEKILSYSRTESGIP